MATVGSLVVNLLGNTQQFRKEFAAIPSFLSGIQGQIAAFISVSAGLAGLGRGMDLAMKAEQAEVSFEVMIGSASRAKLMIGELRDFANKSPFSMQGVTEAGRLLMNFGITANQVMPSIKMLADVAAGDEQKLNRLALVFGQISAKGRLTGDNLKQLTEAGFNPLQEISARTGESIGALTKRMEEGHVGLAEFRQAFIDATSAGGRFFGMNERQSKTVSGLFQQLRDNVDNSLRQIGVTLIETFDIGRIIQTASTWLATFGDWMRSTGRDVIVIGGAIMGFVGGVVALQAALRAATLAVALFRAVSSPLGAATVLIGLVAAHEAVSQLNDMFNATAAAAQHMGAATVAAGQAAASSAKPKGGAASENGPLGEQIAMLRQLQEEREKIGARGGARAGMLDGWIAETQTRIDELTAGPAIGKMEDEHLAGLWEKVRALQNAAGTMSQTQIGFKTDALKQEIDDITGLRERLAELNDEINGMSKIDLEVQKYRDKQSSDEGVAELRKRLELAEKLKDARKFGDTMKDKIKSPGQELTEGLTKLWELRRRKEITSEQFDKMKAYLEKDAAKAEAALVENKGKEKDSPLTALRAGTQEAQQAILRGMIDKAKPNGKLETLAEKQLKAQEESRKHLETLAKRDQDEPVVIETASF